MLNNLLHERTSITANLRGEQGNSGFIHLTLLSISCLQWEWHSVAANELAYSILITNLGGK